MPEPLSLETRRRVRRLVMRRGANALDATLVAALQEALETLSGEGAPPLVLASAHERIFSPGWDVRWLWAKGRDEVGRFLAAFERLVRTLTGYPGPTVAAIGGHAVAGGCLLALACDRRLMVADTARMGLSEINLGVPVPPGCVRLLEARLEPRVVERLLYEGGGFPAETACQMGLVHRVLADRERLEEAAVTEAASLGSRPPAALAAAKRYHVGPLLEAMARAAEEGAAGFLDCWFSDAARELLDALLRRLAR